MTMANTIRVFWSGVRLLAFVECKLNEKNDYGPVTCMRLLSECHTNIRLWVITGCVDHIYSSIYQGEFTSLYNTPRLSFPCRCKSFVCSRLVRFRFVHAINVGISETRVCKCDFGWCKWCRWFGGVVGE